MKGKFDDNTAQFFCLLQMANSGFDSQSINNVKIGAELINRAVIEEITIKHTGEINCIIILIRDSTVFFKFPG